MWVNDVNDRNAVLLAIQEFDRDRHKFLATYGFHEARKYFLEHEDKLYDCKPILWAAFVHLFTGRASQTHASNGVNKFVKPQLQKLGFQVRVL